MSAAAQSLSNLLLSLACPPLGCWGQRRPTLMKKLCSQFPAGNRKKNCITPAYLLDQQFSGQKLLSSAGRNDLWSRTSGLRKWSCSFYLGELSPEMLSGSILLWFLPSKFKLLCPASYVVTPPSCRISMLWIFIEILGNSWLGPTFPHIYPFGWHTPFPYSWAPHWQPLRAFQ